MPSNLGTARKDRTARRKGAVRKKPKIPPGIPIRAWLSIDDFREAFDKARVKTRADRLKLEEAAEQASACITSTLTGMSTPSAYNLSTTARTLSSIANKCSKTVQAIISEIDAVEIIPCYATEVEEVASFTMRMRDAFNRQASPVLTALINAAAGPDRPHIGSAMEHSLELGIEQLVTSLLAIERLQFWARASSQQFQVAVAREKENTPLRNLRGIPERLCWVFISIYVDSTGRPPAFSRPSSSKQVDQAGAVQKDRSSSEPCGPLIRFLTALYELTHTKLNDEFSPRGLTGDQGWVPRPETLATWIENYRLQRKDSNHDNLHHAAV